MVVRIAGKRMYLWRAVDHEGEVLECLGVPAIRAELPSRAGAQKKQSGRELTSSGATTRAQAPTI